MPKKIQRLNVIDLECTAWEDQHAPNGEQQSQYMEIIEIGIAQVDLKTLEIVDKKSFLVMPIEYGLSDYCQALTSITPEMLAKDGVSLKLAIAQMMSEFKTKKYEWASWGDFDRMQFERECQRKNLEYPLSKTHLNIKYWLSQLTGQRVQRNVSGMMDFLQMKFDGTAHRGIDDAVNTARMFIEINKIFREESRRQVKNGFWGDEFYATVKSS